MKKQQKICVRCVMDDTDPGISFDANGLCDYCRNFDNTILPNWNNTEGNETSLTSLSKKIKKSAKNREFDCIIGLSGGLDSSYAAHVVVKKMGLKPLLLHVDAGWNTEVAVSNIEKVVDGLSADLYTEVIDWRSVQKMQTAFLRSGIADQDLVQDAAFFSSLYKFAKRHRVKHIITGSNFSTECCREPEAWGGYLGVDTWLFKDIWKKHGEGNLGDFPILDIFVYKIIYRYLFGMRVHSPLNFVRYNKKEAEEELSSLYGWQPFQHKHHESRFTRFFEDFWLPVRFGYDKRKAHFSSLILTGQMTRSAALARLAKPELEASFLEKEFSYVARKLNLTDAELDRLLTQPIKYYTHYSNKRWMVALGAKLLRSVGVEKRYFR